MALRFALFALLAAASAAAQPSRLLAPSDESSVQHAPAIVQDDQALFSSIETEASWATSLYVASIFELAAGVPALVTGLAWDASCPCGAAPRALSISALIVVALGILTLPIAIGLDIDSRTRRRSLSLATEPFGLEISGTF